MRIHGLMIASGVTLAAALAACSSSTMPSSTAPNGGNAGGGGTSNSVSANYTFSGGSYVWSFAPTPDTIAAGGAVTFMWSAAQHNIHFDAVAGAPDSVPTSNNASVSRTFMTPGTYNYHCTIHPMSGVIVVH